VVADEVRNLAIRSAEAAKNTADLIASTISSINSGTEMVHATSEAFKSVGAQAGEVTGLVSEVAEASGEQSRGIEQISQAVTEMDRVTQSNAARADESAGEAHRLSRQAEHLSAAVNKVVALMHGAQAVGLGQEAPRLAAPPKPPALGGAPEPAPKALPMGEGSSAAPDG